LEIVLLVSRASTKYVLGLTLGSIMSCAFAPCNWWPLAFICPLALIFLWHNCTPREGFILGWLFIFGLYVVGLKWILECITDLGINRILAVIYLIVFLGFYACLFTNLIGYIYRRFWYKNSFANLCFSLPCLWVLLEWLRSWLCSGYPWFIIGYSQLDTPLRNYAPIFSVFGVSFFLIQTVCLLFIILTFKPFWSHTKTCALLTIVAIWGGGLLLEKVNWVPLAHEKYEVGIIQANITKRLKTLMRFDEHINLYGPLLHNAKDYSLIILPEASIPLYSPLNQGVINLYAKFAQENNTSVIIGTLQLNSSSNKLRNTMLVLGTGSGSYTKQHLLAWWELLPFEKVLRNVPAIYEMKKFWFEPGSIATDLPHNAHSKIAPSICYEIVFPELVRHSILNSQAEVIVNISEDAWIDHGWGLEQNLQIVRMRALETGRYILRSATSGISAIIDPKGKIISQTQLHTRQVLHGNYQNAEGLTPWLYIGTNKLMLGIALLFLISILKNLYAYVPKFLERIPEI